MPLIPEPLWGKGKRVLREPQLSNTADAKMVARTVLVCTLKQGKGQVSLISHLMSEKEGPSETNKFKPFCPGEKMSREGHTAFTGCDTDN